MAGILPGDCPPATGHRDDLGAAAILFALPFLVLGRALVPGNVLSSADNLLAAWPWKALAPSVVPTNPLLVDASTQFQPWLIYAGRAIAHGRVPLWNPHAFGGAPFFAAAQHGLLFPLNALAYVLPAPLALTLIAILKHAVAGLAMYWLLRGLALAVPAAFVGALAFMWSGGLVVWLHGPLATVLGVVPLVLGTTHRLRERGGPRWLAATAIAVGLSILAGYPQGAFYTIGAALAWALTLAPGAPAGARRFLASVAAAVALGLVLGAVQLVPFLEYLRESAVAAYRAEWVPFMHLPPHALVTLFLPHYYGTPAGRDYRGPFNFNVVTVSVGIVPWLVLPVALAAARRSLAARYFAGLGILSAAMLYGAPGTGTLASIPPFSMTGNLRFGALLVVALAGLSGVGVDAVARAAASDQRRRVAAFVRAGVLVSMTFVLVVVARDLLAVSRDSVRTSLATQYGVWLGLVVLAALCALRWLRDGALRWAVLLAAVELASALPLAAGFNPVIDARLLYPEPPVLGALRTATAQDGSRVLTGAYNVAMLYGLSEPTGYDAMTPRRIADVAGPIGAPRLVGLLGTEPLSPGAVFASPALDLMAVRHLVVPPAATLGAPLGAPVDPRFVLEYDGPDGRVFRNDSAMPRAMVVARARCVEDGEAIRVIRRRELDARREVLLAAPCGALPAPTPAPMPMPASTSTPNGGASRTSDQGARATIREDGAETIVIDAVTDAPAYLVLADTWFPGWRATVDGVDQPVLRANHAFRAVSLTSGSHAVRFEYRPWSVRIGLAGSVAAALVIVGLVVGGRRRASA